MPQANLTSIDPIWTTANITRNYGHMVYDTLYGIDQNFVAQPQMAAGHLVEDDGRRVTITLREGLLFHDGTPVRAADAAQSIRRWTARTAYGLKLKDVLDEITAPVHLQEERVQQRLADRLRAQPALSAGRHRKPQPDRRAQGGAFRPRRVAESDWGTVIQRRTSREPVEKGGWSVLCTASSSFDQADPAAHSMIRGNGAAGWPGWPAIPRLETLRDAWFDAPTLDAQRSIAAEIQQVALDEVSYIPLGSYYGKTALRRDLTGRVPGLMLLWNLHRV